MDTKNFSLNKPYIDDERASAKARGKRLKRVRNLANLSRREMCDDPSLNININTLKGWEIARHGGLTRDGAIRSLQRVAQEGVSCSLEWLLYEVGRSPSVGIIKENTIEKTTIGVSTIQKQIDPMEEQRINHELLLFRKQYPDAIDAIVTDNGMDPWYKPDEVVAGVKHKPDDIFSLIGMDVIVKLKSNGLILVRRLYEGASPCYYNLLCLNHNTTVENPVLFNVELEFAAPIIWHRRKNLISVAAED